MKYLTIERKRLGVFVFTILLFLILLFETGVGQTLPKSEAGKLPPAPQGRGSGVAGATGAGIGAASGTGVGRANGTGVGAANGTGSMPRTVRTVLPKSNVATTTDDSGISPGAGTTTGQGVGAARGGGVGTTTGDGVGAANGQNITSEIPSVSGTGNISGNGVTTAPTEAPSNAVSTVFTETPAGSVQVGMPSEEKAKPPEAAKQIASSQRIYYRELNGACFFLTKRNGKQYVSRDHCK